MWATPAGVHFWTAAFSSLRQWSSFFFQDVKSYYVWRRYESLSWAEKYHNTFCHSKWRINGGSRPEVFFKKGVRRNFAKFTGKHVCQILFLFEACDLIKKETLTQVFPYEFCEISKNTFSYRTPPVAASELRNINDWFA